MDNANKLLALLKNRLDMFLELEKCIIGLNECDIDVMKDYITKSGTISNQIDDISKEISSICCGMHTSPPIDDILSNRCYFSDVPDELKPLFSVSQQAIAAVNRCRELNQSAVIRMETLRGILKRRILETSNTPKIKKYLSASGAANADSHGFSRTRKA